MTITEEMKKAFKSLNLKAFFCLAERVSLGDPLFIRVSAIFVFRSHKFFHKLSMDCFVFFCAVLERLRHHLSQAARKFRSRS